jgi:hypothetical protein
MNSTKKYVRSLMLAALFTGFAVQTHNAEASLKSLARKLKGQKKKKKDKAPKVKPFEKTPSGFGKNDELVIGIDKIIGGQCKRGGGATGYRVSVSVMIWSQNGDYSERVGPIELASEEIAAVNPKQVVASESEIRIPVEQLNAALEEMGYSRMVADKPKMLGSTLGIGIDPMGPCSKLSAVPYRGLGFAPPSVFLDLPNPYYSGLGDQVGGGMISQKPINVTVIDNDAARLGDAQGSSTKTSAALTVGIEDK